MHIDEFDYHLPEALIAHYPAEPRELARLLHISKNDDGHATLDDKHIRDLPDLLHAGDVMVFNESKVIPARLYGRRNGATGRVEILLHKPVTETVWECWARPAKKLKSGGRIEFASDFEAILVRKTDGGFVHLDFAMPRATLLDKLHAHGLAPLPPYIKRAADSNDIKTYQTVYARVDGSVAAPTAGLHFTPDLLARITAKKVTCLYVTLHVGAGTFKPVQVEQIRDHVMHFEWGEVSADVARTLNEARTARKRIIAVGTTAARLLESATDTNGTVQPFSNDTNLFITPGYAFRCVDALMTNFHLPKSTLFMLVCAMMGTETMRAAYAHATSRGYRFFSYGDACFLEPNLRETASSTSCA